MAEHRRAASGCDLGALLVEVNYGGGANTIDKLPLGTVIQLVVRLTQCDSELARACPPEIRKALTVIVERRNETTHELAPGGSTASDEPMQPGSDVVCGQPCGPILPAAGHLTIVSAQANLPPQHHGAWLRSSSTFPDSA
jgi:hypothetical protein